MTYNEDGSVTYTKDEHSRAQKKLQWLNYLEMAGADNSEAWDYALDLRAEAEGSDDE